MIECPKFRSLLLLLRPDLAEKNIPHRTRLRESIIEAWKTWFESLKIELSVCFFLLSYPTITYSNFLGHQRAVGKISFTANVWSDQNRNSFLCVTVHWISRNSASNCLAFKNTLIGFHCLEDSHTGVHLAKALFGIINHAGIIHRVCFSLLCCLGLLHKRS